MNERVFALMCRGENEPVNIMHPVDFSWSLGDCTVQKSFAYRLYEDDMLLYSFEAESSAQRFVLPESVALKPLKRYVYEITAVTDKFSSVARANFRTGLIGGFSPCAKWIGNGAHFVEDNGVVGSKAVYFYKTFQMEKASRDATVHLCGLGLYELHINGKRVGDRVLEPGFTQYDKRVLYSSYDVSEYLHEGDNDIKIVLGDGWYNQTTRDTWGFYRAAWRDAPKLIFELHAGDVTVVSDADWKTSCGEIVSNAIRAGETHDLRSGNPNKCKAVLVPPPGGALVPAYLPPVRECEKLQPISVTESDAGTIYDFGKNIAGYCEAVFQADSECEVKIEYTDRISDGMPDNASNKMYIFNDGLEYQTDTFLLPKGIHAVKPKFVYHGFRYACVSGKARVKKICAYFVHTDLKQVGVFSSSSAMLDKLYAMSGNAILANYHSFPTDCPHREKNGWTGDAQLSLEPCVYRYDMREAYRKWLDDFADNMRDSGQISAIIPSCGWGYNWGSGPAWDVAMFRITHALWYYYDDGITARKMLPYLIRYFDYISGYADKDGIINVGLGDWNYPKKEKFEVCPTGLTDTGYYVVMARILAELCHAYMPEHKEKYLSAAKNAELAIKNKFTDEKSLTGLAALSYFGVADKSSQVAEYLVSHDCKPHFGILGAKFVLDTLGKSGLVDIGLGLLERKEYPSFGYWAINGQTALCEDFELTNSLNHHMYSPVAEFMQKYICGLRMGKNMQSADIVPALPLGLDNARTRLDTLYGSYEVSLLRTDKGVRVDFVVPPNAHAYYKGKKYTCGSYTEYVLS